MASKGQHATGGVVRAGHAGDLPALQEILREAPETVDWLPDTDSASLDSRGTVFLVGEFKGQVKGFVVGRQIADEAEILNIAVGRAGRRCGLGSMLLDAILEVFRRRQAKRIFLEVRESNAAAIAFYYRHGFGCAGRRPDYYQHPQESALLLRKELTG